MADYDKERGTVDSAASDAKKAYGAGKNIAGAVRMGREAAKAVPALSQAAAHAASGDAAGAALAALRDERTRKIILAAILIPVLLLFSVMVLFLYSLPTTVYEAVCSYFGSIAENWNEITYGGAGSTFWNGIYATINSAGQIVWDVLTSAAEYAKSLWDGLVSFFSDGGGADINGGADSLTPDALELHVTQIESAEKKTLEGKLDACKKKVNARAAALREAVESVSGDIDGYFREKTESEYPDCEYGGVTLSFSMPTFGRRQAIKLLSLYTVQTEANVTDLRISDYLKWLGYDSPGAGKTIYFTVGGAAVCSVKAWKGTFLPQYLVEQMKYEKDEYGAAVTDYSQSGCSAVDLMLVVGSPDFASLAPTLTVVTKDDGGERTKEDEKAGVETVTIASWIVSVSIRCRSAGELAKIAGLWDGPLPLPDIEGEGS